MNFNIPPQLQQQHNPQQYVIKFSKKRSQKKCFWTEKCFKRSCVEVCFKFSEICGEKIRVLRKRCVSCLCYVLLSSRQFYELLELQSMDSNLRLHSYFRICTFLQIVRPLTRKTNHILNFFFNFIQTFDVNLYRASIFCRDTREFGLYIYPKIQVIAYICIPDIAKQKPQKTKTTL